MARTGRPSAHTSQSRATIMLTPFLGGEDDHHESNDYSNSAVLQFKLPLAANHLHAPPLHLLLRDNSSTSSNHHCPSYVDCLYNDDGNESCISIRFAWLLGRIIKLYVSHPFLLALVPLGIGLVLGIWMGRRTTSHITRDHTMNTKLSNYHPRRCCWWWESIRMLLNRFIPMHLRDTWRRRFTHVESDWNPKNTRLQIQQHPDDTKRESGVDIQRVPRHIGVIMDGNRRYGTAKYGNATQGHWDGSKTLLEFTKWCMAEGVQVLTVYAFSTENFHRDPAEVAALMNLFCQYCDELRVEAVQHGIRVYVLETDSERIPSDVREGIDRMVSQTKDCDRFIMNICLSYGARGEIVNACKGIARDVVQGTMDVDDIGEIHLQKRMLTEHCCDPDIILRTSGEERLSNFLLWQCAYSELFFVKKPWPELEKSDLIEVIRTFAHGRKRRFGK